MYLPSISGKSHRNVYSVTLWPALFSTTSGQTKLQQAAGLLLQAHLDKSDNVGLMEDSLMHEYIQEYQGLHKFLAWVNAQKSKR